MTTHNNADDLPCEIAAPHFHVKAHYLDEEGGMHTKDMVVMLDEPVAARIIHVTLWGMS